MIKLDDTEANKMLYSEQCHFCKHLKDGEKQICSAFPNGVPKDLWSNFTKHDHILPNQNGNWRFEAK